MKNRFLPISLCVLAALSMAATAASPATQPQPKLVPRMQIVPQPYAQLSFQRDGVEVARYHYGRDLRRPFVFPLIGPSGRSVTRMGHPHDPETHSHHNSVWVAHHDVNGVSFWGDAGKGRIVHQRIESLEDTDAFAAVNSVNHWVDEQTDKVLLIERRRTELRPLDNGELLLILDIEFTAKEPQVTFGKTSFGTTAVRMAKTIGVIDGGGRILNSEGAVNEKQVFWKPARWVDYSGPITATAMEGATLMDHPSNLNHPSVYHVRDDGWMGASLTFDGPRTLTPADPPLHLRYGVYVHAGVPELAALQRQWEQFAKKAPYVFPTKKVGK